MSKKFFEEVSIISIDDQFQAFSPRTELVAYGETKEEALENLAQQIKKQMLSCSDSATNAGESLRAEAVNLGSKEGETVYLAVIVDLFSKQGYMTVKEAARMLNITESRITTLIKVGKLRALRFDNRVFVKASDVRHRVDNPALPGRPKSPSDPQANLT